MPENNRSRPGVVTGQRVDPAKLDRARELRRNQTPAEALLWERLKDRQLDGFKFRRQQLIDGFIADFYCSAAGLVIEVDGAIHENRVEADAHRDDVFLRRGLVVLRLTNDEVQQSTEAAYARIATACRDRSGRAIYGPK